MTRNREQVEIPITLLDFEDYTFRFRRDFQIEEVMELAESIRKTGQLNPTKVRKKKDGRYQILAGWRRAYAVKWLGDRPLLCDAYVGISEKEAYEVNIADNEQHEDLTATELAHQVAHLKNAGYSVEQLAEMFMCKKSKVYDLLQLDQMPARIKDAVHKGNLTIYHAIEIEKLPVSERLEILEKTVEEGWSVRRIRQERQKYDHPFFDSTKLPLYFTRKNTWHAFRFFRTPDVEQLWIKHWEILGRDSGIPAPMKCEFTMSIPARKREPPFVCDNDIQWVVLSSGDLPSSRGIEKIERWGLPLEERDGWFFWCERCVKLLFPNCVFHHDKIFGPLLD